MAEQTFEITAPNGKTLSITGDHMPNEAELHDIFAKAGVATGAASAASAPTAAVPNPIVNGAAALAPSVGGIVGGMVGGTPGAAVGGAAGEGYRQILQHGAELPGAIVDVARNLVHEPMATLKGAVEGAGEGAVAAGLQAGGQAAGQVAGNVLAAGGGTMAKWLMNRATSRVSAKLMADFPELSDTLIDNALTVSQGGFDKAKALLLAAKAKSTVALGVAERAGATIPVTLTPDLAESLKTALLEKAVKAGQIPVTPGQPLTVATQRLTGPLKTLFADIDAAASGGPFELSPTQADLFKTQLQKESRALYANRAPANGARAMGMDATELADFATQLNSAIDDVATGYKAGNAEAKPLIGAVRGIKQAIRPNGNLYQAMVRPAVGAVLGEEAGRRGGVSPIASAAAGAALTSPAGMSREAIILAHPVMQSVLQQLPKPAAAALIDFLTTHLPALLQAPGGPPASLPAMRAAPAEAR